MKQSQQHITNEITRQLKLVKYQIDFELEQDNLKIMDRLTSLESSIKNLEQRLVALESSSSKSVTNTTDNQLAVMHSAIVEQTRDHINKATIQMGQRIYTKITDEINVKIAPKLENLVQFVSYNNQDTSDIINRYRDHVAGDKKS